MTLDYDGVTWQTQYNIYIQVETRYKERLLRVPHCRVLLSASVRGRKPMAFRELQPTDRQKTDPRKSDRGKLCAIFRFCEFMDFDFCFWRSNSPTAPLYIYLGAKCQETFGRVSRCRVLLFSSLRWRAPMMRRE